MEYKFGTKNPYTKKYFYGAMDYFREEHENVIFLYVSDDMEWGKKNLKNKEKDLFFIGTILTANFHFSFKQLEFAGKGDVDSEEAVGQDLALLTSCNHTVVTWGTFSMWVATLAGGEYYTQYGVIVPKHIQEPEKKKKRRKN